MENSSHQDAEVSAGKARSSINAPSKGARWA
jgi:hypothetical protein